MLTSKAWLRRLAHKSSALGIASVLGLIAASVFVFPARAATKEVTYSYTCTGALLSTQSATIQVKLSTPDTVSGTATVTWSLPPLTLAAAPQGGAAHLKAAGKLAVTQGGTPADLAYTGTVSITSTAVPATTMTSTVAVTGASGSNLVLGASAEPLILTLDTPATGAPQSSCTTTGTGTLTVPIGTGGGGGGGGAEGEVWYRCTGVDTGNEQVKLTVTLTPPTNARAGQNASIGWSATNAVAESDQLKAPAGMSGAQKVFVDLSLTGAGLTTGSGEGAIATVTAGQAIVLPASVQVKVKPTTTGTVTVKPGRLRIGASASTATITCALDTAQTDLKSYTFTVGGASTPKPTTTKTVIVTETPKTPIGKIDKTPKAGAETGGGGDLGPDARTFLLAGAAMMTAAGAGGLWMRRRSARG